MKTTLKLWTGLGLATALGGAGLSSCAQGTEDRADQSDIAQAANAGEGSSEGSNRGRTADGGEMGEMGESGESGEGGVDITAAASDPIAYDTALAVVEAHVIAARDAFLAGKPDSAGEMFAHPVSEVLLDMDPVFAERGVEDFKPLLLEASSAALGGANDAQINQHYDAIIAALRKAGEKAPQSGLSETAIAGGVIAEMIERAAVMYPEAINSDRYEPYLDGYGFYKTAEASFANSAPAIKAENPGLYASIETAIALLKNAYPSAERPSSLDANQGELRAAASQVQLRQ